MVTIVYLYWSTFGLETMDPLMLPSDAWVLSMAGNLLYAMFYVFVVVVLLNALIAVMSNVYNDVEVSLLIWLKKTFTLNDNDMLFYSTTIMICFFEKRIVCFLDLHSSCFVKGLQTKGIKNHIKAKPSQNSVIDITLLLRLQ